MLAEINQAAGDPQCSWCSLMFGQSNYCGVAFLHTRVWLPLASAPSKREGNSVLGSAIYQHHNNGSFCALQEDIRQKT